MKSFEIYKRQKNDKYVDTTFDNRRNDRSQESGSKNDIEKARKHIGPGYAGRIAKAAFVGTLALTAGMGGAMADQSRSLQHPSDSGDSTGLTPASLTVSESRVRFTSDKNVYYVPTPQDYKEAQKLEKKWENPPFYFNPPKESEETPQSTTDIHQDKDKGKEPLSSNEKEIATLKAVTEKAGKDPEFAARVRRMLAERQPLSEQKNETSVPERRRLDHPDNQCLDIGLTDISHGKVVPITTPPGDAVEFTIEGVTYNKCGSTVSNVKYTMEVVGTCPSVAVGPQVTETITITDPKPIANDKSGFAPSRKLQGSCYVVSDGQIVGAVAPTAIEVSGFATANDANSKAVRSNNIDRKVFP